jgi:hypothetical protein
VAKRTDVSFPSQGESCAAWHLAGEGDAFSGDAGRPCVVMAHGFGCTRDSGLVPFAEAICVDVDIENELIRIDPPEGLLEF